MIEQVALVLTTTVLRRKQMVTIDPSIIPRTTLHNFDASCNLTIHGR
ncbi:MAG: hypothetical protein AAB649_02855 [Patescibacteria group bacterium]